MFLGLLKKSAWAAGSSFVILDSALMRDKPEKRTECKEICFERLESRRALFERMSRTSLKQEEGKVGNVTIIDRRGILRRLLRR